ncbi:sensor domain-containing diguanylate cyclase [Paraglaciecola aestuariivivens]
MQALNQSWRRFLPRIIAIVLFVGSMGVFAPIALHFGKAITHLNKTSDNGVVILSEEDFVADRKVALTGKWWFFEEQLLTPNQIPAHKNQGVLMTAQSGWQLKNQGAGQVNGFGTYHIEVKLPKEGHALAIHIPKIETAYTFFLNDELVAKGGIVAKSKAQAQAGYHPKLVLIPKNLDSVTITIQVSSFHSTWGGIWSPITIGNANDMFATQRDLVALSMFILGVLAITAAYYLIQFQFRPSEHLPLVFATLCILLFFREFTNEHMLFILQFMGIGFAAGTKINYLTFYVGLPVLLYFMQLCFPQVFNAKITRVCYIIAAAFSLFVLFSPTDYIGHSLISYQLFCFVCIVYLIGCLIVANKRRLPAAKMMMLGSVIISAFAINDMLYVADVINTGRFFSLGIVGFIVCQSYVINNRFNQVLTRNETLSGQLQQRNIELLQLGTELENKVELRTRELEQANRELQALAEIDNLTHALNRHGLQQYLQSAYERLRRSKEPCSIILFDFDNFKDINDTYGHDSGDAILMASATLVMELIREQDKLARWGGEEFLVLLPATDLEGALAIAEKIRIAISRELSNAIADEVAVTITAGVAELKHDETFEIIFKRADNALYKGKRSGRNNVQC